MRIRLWMCLALAVAASANAQWRPWTNVATAVEDVIAATRERLEATFDRTVVTTQAVAVCSGGMVTTNLLVLTNRLYLVSAGAPANDLGAPGDTAFLAPSAVTDPIHVLWTGAVSQSTGLVYVGMQTSLWTNASGVVATSAVAQYRVDDLWTVTSRYTCAVSTNDYVYRWLTSAPPAWISWSFVSEVDAALDRLMETETFVDRSHASTDGTFDVWFATPSGSNWSWTGSAWVSTPAYPADFPRLSRARIWALAGIGTVRTNIVVTDQGAGYPRIETNTVAGWIAGDLASQWVSLVSTNPRYVSATNLEYLYSYGQSVETSELARIVSARSAQARAGNLDVLCETIGFGTGLDGLWMASATARVQVAAALSNAGWVMESRAIGQLPSLGQSFPLGCWRRSNAWAEVVLPARWTALPGDSFTGVVRVAVTTAQLMVWASATSELECVSSVASPAAFPEPYEVEIVGKALQAATGSNGTVLAVVTQRVMVASTGSVMLAHAFLEVDRISASNSVLASTNFATAAGLQMAVRQAVAGRTFWGRLPPLALTNALAERRAVLSLMQWTAGGVSAWSNIQRGASSFVTSQAYTVKALDAGSGASCSTNFGTAFVAAGCSPAWPSLAATTELLTTWASWHQECDQVSQSRRYDGTFISGASTSWTGWTSVEAQTNEVSWFASLQQADASAIWSDRIGLDLDRYESFTTVAASVSAPYLTVSLSCPSISPWDCAAGWPAFYCEGELVNEEMPGCPYDVLGARVAESMAVGSWSTNASASPRRDTLVRVAATNRAAGGAARVWFTVAPAVTPEIVTWSTNWTAAQSCTYLRTYGGVYDDTGTGSLEWSYGRTSTRSSVDVAGLKTVFLARWAMRYGP